MTDDQFKQLLEQDNTRLMERIDARLEENNTRLDKRLDERFEQNNAALFGQLAHYLDKRFEKLTDELTTRTDRIYNMVDGIARRLDADEQERAAINEEQQRQNGWIGQLAIATNTKLVPEQ